MDASECFALQQHQTFRDAAPNKGLMLLRQPGKLTLVFFNFKLPRDLLPAQPEVHVSDLPFVLMQVTNIQSAILARLAVELDEKSAALSLGRAWTEPRTLTQLLYGMLAEEWWLFLTSEDLGRMFNHSFPAYPFFFLK